MESFVFYREATPIKDHLFRNAIYIYVDGYVDIDINIDIGHDVGHDGDIRSEEFFICCF